VSLGFYGFTAIRVLRSSCLSDRTRWWALAALSILALFEVNPGSRMSQWVETSPEDPGAPGSLNVPGALAVSCFLLLVFGGLVFSRGTTFLRALRAGATEAWIAVWGVAFQPLAFGIDLLQTTRFNWYRGYRMEKGIYFASDVVEESLEFLIPVLFLIALLYWERRRR
jgi:hypothetical protein